MKNASKNYLLVLCSISRKNAFMLVVTQSALNAEIMLKKQLKTKYLQTLEKHTLTGILIYQFNKV